MLMPLQGALIVSSYPGRCPGLCARCPFGAYFERMFPFGAYFERMFPFGVCLERMFPFGAFFERMFPFGVCLERLRLFSDSTCET